MLRIRVRSFSAQHVQAAAVGPVVEIIPIFNDSTLELARLLREAANIEHALLVQYLFAGFSVRDRYSDLAGDTFASPSTLVGVAIQEMHHLAKVNRMLVSIGQWPTLDREDFPIRTDLYPFLLELESLTKKSAAKYVAAESPADALDPDTAPSAEERAFRLDVASELGSTTVNHIGSLYGTIIACVAKVRLDNPGLLADPDAMVLELEQIRNQGVHEHFQFFRSVFEATHPAFRGEDVWADPSGELYPSVQMDTNPSALEGSANVIGDVVGQRLAWLADMHYWVVLQLLWLSQGTSWPELSGRAISHMGACLFPLGKALAAKGIGVPFDPIGRNAGPGLDKSSCVTSLIRLLHTLQKAEGALGADLPVDYPLFVAKATLKELGET